MAFFLLWGQLCQYVWHSRRGTAGAAGEELTQIAWLFVHNKRCLLWVASIDPFSFHYARGIPSRSPRPQRENSLCKVHRRRQSIQRGCRHVQRGRSKGTTWAQKDHLLARAPNADIHGSCHGHAGTAVAPSRPGITPHIPRNMPRTSPFACVRVCLCVCVCACVCVRVCVCVCVCARRRADPSRLGCALRFHAGMLDMFTVGLGLGRKRT